MQIFERKLEYSRTHEDLAATTSPCRDDPWPWRHGSVTMTWRSVRTGLYIHLCVSGTGTKLSQDRIKQGVCCNIFAFFFSNRQFACWRDATGRWFCSFGLNGTARFIFCFWVWGHVFHFSKTCTSAISCSHDHFPWKQGSQWRSNSAIQRVQGDLFQVTAMGLALKEGRGWSYWKTQLVGLIWTFCPVLLVHDRNSSTRNGSRYLYQRTFRNVIQWSNKNPSVQLFLMWSFFDVGKSNNKPSQYDHKIHGWIVGSLPNQQTGRVSCSWTTGQPVDGLREFAGKRTSWAATFAQILWPGRRRLVKVGAGWWGIGEWICV